MTLSLYHISHTKYSTFGILGIMEQFPGTSAQFKSPHEELAFLREQIARKEAELSGQGIEQPRDVVATEVVQQYRAAPTPEVLHPEAQLTRQEHEGIQLRLSPEKHDETTAELMTIMMEKGVKNALDVLARMQNPHLDDDFHRFLVQYLASYQELPGITPKQEIWKSADMSLFEIALPEATDQAQDFRQMIALMERFYAGMQAIGPGDNPDKRFISIECAVQNVGKQIVFYIAVPRKSSDLLEKQILGLYPTARVEELTNDYNIFADGGVTAAAVGSSSVRDVLLMKTYDTFDHDPVDVVLNAFSKIDHEGEGAAIQVIIRPAGQSFLKQYGSVLEKLRKGESMKEIYKGVGDVLKSEAKVIGKAFSSMIFGGGGSGGDKKPEDKKLDDDAIASITEKLKSTIVETNIRIVACANNEPRAKALVDEIGASFHQFLDPKGTGIDFKQQSGKDLASLLHKFSYRLYDEGARITLNMKELATLMHFPASSKDAPTLKQAMSGTAPAPLEMGTEGIFLGENQHRGQKTPIHFAPADRLRHFYTIGQTGVGKTQLFLKMIIQDIKNGDGCCFIDPHGTDINTILANIPPERIDDVIYFDPSHTARPMGLNMMEFDERFPIQKTLVVAELLSIFDKLFDMKAQGGAMFGQYFRNAALLVMEDPASGNTMLEITRVLASKPFRDMKLAKCKNPIITEFWKGAEKTTGDQGLENFVPYISSKFDDFISNEIMRPVVLQEQSAFNFRKVMDEKKILLVNLSKGLLGEKNAQLIGLVLVGKLQMAALSRADTTVLSDFPPFYMYIDEFQNVTTDSITSILSEARKYKLSLNITHQYLEQLPENIKGAVFGNVGSMAFFRIKSEDAAYVEPRIAPAFTKDDIVKLDNFQAVTSMLVGGRPARAFNLNTLSDGYAPKGNPDQVEKLKQLSYLKYGRPREEIEAEIMEKYRTL